jgi:hypothetical protein
VEDCKEAFLSDELQILQELKPLGSGSKEWPPRSPDYLFSKLENKRFHTVPMSQNLSEIKLLTPNARLCHVEFQVLPMASMHL